MFVIIRRIKAFRMSRPQPVPTTRRPEHRFTHHGPVPTPPESTKHSLRHRLITRTHQRWPQLADLTVRHHGQFAYIDGQLPDGTTLPLFLLRYGGSAHSWGFGPSASLEHGCAPRLSCGQTISGTRRCATANSKSHWSSTSAFASWLPVALILSNWSLF